MSGADVSGRLDTDAHESTSIRFGTMLRGPAIHGYVSRPATTGVALSSRIFPGRVFAAFPGRFLFLHVFSTVGVLAVSCGVARLSSFVPSFRAPWIAYNLFSRPSDSPLRSRRPVFGCPIFRVRSRGRQKCLVLLCISKRFES